MESETEKKHLSRRYLDAVELDVSQFNNLGDFEKVKILNTKHIAKFCFSSVGVLLKKELSLDTNLIFRKFSEYQQGGYCFEHNKLFFFVLLELGLNVKPVLSRVLYDVDIHQPKSPKTHRISILNTGNEKYLVDVGFGANGPKAPILISEEPTIGPWGEKYRIAKNREGDYLMQVYKDDHYYTLYSFDDGVYNDADFEMSHFYSYCHPSAGFVNNLVVSCILEDEIRSLRNGSFRRISRNSTETTEIVSVKTLTKILNNEFGVFESVVGIEYLFNRFCKVEMC